MKYHKINESKIKQNNLTDIKKKINLNKIILNKKNYNK